MELFKKYFFTNKGFSLVELLIVVAILGIISAIAIPSYQNYKIGTGKQIVRSTAVDIKKALDACLSASNENATKCDSWEELDIYCDTPRPSNKNTSFGTSPSSTTGNKLVCRGLKSGNNICISIYYKTTGKEGGESCVDSKENIYGVKEDVNKKGTCNSSAECKEVSY